MRKYHIETEETIFKAVLRALRAGDYDQLYALTWANAPGRLDEERLGARKAVTQFEHEMCGGKVLFIDKQSKDK